MDIYNIEIINSVCYYIYNSNTPYPNPHKNTNLAVVFFLTVTF